MNRIFKISICAVLVIWIFASGLIIGTFKERKSFKSQLEEMGYYNINDTTQPSVPYSTDGIKIDMVTNIAPVTSSPSDSTSFSLEMPTGGGNLTTYKSDAQKQLEVPSGNAAIAKALSDAVNTTKSMKSFTATKSENADFVIDSVTGGGTVKNIVEGIMNKVVNKPQATYSFSNGVDNNGSTETPGSIIPPSNKTAKLDETAIKSASAQANSFGGYDITVYLNDETQTLSQKATNHDSILDTFDISSVSLPSSFKMGEMNFTYSGACIKASVNSDGRLVSVDYVLPISSGSVSGTMLSMTVAVALHGTYSAKLSITY